MPTQYLNCMLSLTLKGCVGKRPYDHHKMTQSQKDTYDVELWKNTGPQYRDGIPMTW